MNQQKSSRIGNRAKLIIPHRLKKFIRNHPLKNFQAPILDTNLLAFRAFIVCKTAQLFDHDAKLARAFSVNHSQEDK